MVHCFIFQFHESQAPPLTSLQISTVKQSTYSNGESSIVRVSLCMVLLVENLEFYRYDSISPDRLLMDIATVTLPVCKRRPTVVRIRAI